MKIAISIPDDLFRAADRAAKRLGLSRSTFYQHAVAQYLERQSDSLVTEALNEVYRGQDRSTVDRVLDRLQRASLPVEKW
jgi:metal-responsive CopG/Arc/MetJ family transcriptional regulator